MNWSIRFFYTKILFLILSFFLFIHCSSDNDKKKKEIKDIVNTWLSRVIEIPESLEPILINATAHDAFDTYSQKIIVYINSAGCVECSLGKSLPYWVQNIKEIESTELKNRTCFIFIINSNNPKQVASHFHNTQFNYPIYFDHTDEFNKRNRLPENPLFHVMLLNKENKVLLIGSPVNNDKMWNMYKKHIIE